MNYAALLLIAVLATVSPVMVGHFSSADLENWQSKTFAGQTRYQIADIEGKPALRAESQGGASGLYREIEVDLDKTPYLNWSWRIDKVLEGVDERSKAGDDFAARVYVVVSGGLAFWKTRSLVYVWSSHQPVNTAWHNPYTANARHIALRSGNAQAGRWVTEKRNVREDFKRLFGDGIETIDAVALMTDTDNSGQSASAWYGDIYFTAE